MAKIREELVVIKLSTLVKSDDAPTAATAVTDDFCANVEELVSELVGPRHIVEIIKE